MYINPFLAGVIAVIGLELAAIVIAATIEAFKRKDNSNDE